MPGLNALSAAKGALRSARDSMWDAWRDACVARYIELPIDPGLVVFDNFNGGGYGCNPKYMAEALADSGLRLVWLARNPRDGFPPYITPVKYDTPEAWRALATAGVRVSNVRNYKGVPKRRGQFYIQTWHAMLAFKAIEGQVQDLLTQDYLDQAKLDGASTDVMFANNAVDEALYRNHFWYDGPVLRVGMPRMVPILRPKQGLVERVREGLGVPEGKKVVLYAPTFRDSDYGYFPPFDAQAFVDALERRTGDEYVCLVRLHPNASAAGAVVQSEGVINATAWPDAQEVLAISDVLVTDYSSMAFEQMAANRPVFLYVPDVDAYERDSRAFALSPFDSPFPACRAMDELVDAVRSFDRAEMLARYGAFREETGYADDGRGDLMLAGVILEHCSRLVR